MFFNVSLFNKALDLFFKKYSGAALAKKSVAFGVITSCFLIAIKFGAWLITDSISMQASMNDSILDALTSFLAYHALIFSSIKFDKSHNFGHEKVEGIMALFQCIIVIYSGFVIFKEAYEVFLEPKPILNSDVGIVVMVISCVAVYQLLYFQRYVALKTDSILVKGDSLHYMSDFFMNLCIIISLFLSKFFVYIDVICGISVGCYVLYNAFLIIKNALVDLMDEALPIETRSKILKIIQSVAGVKGVKILRTRSAGMKRYIDSKIIVDKSISIVEANDITLTVEKELKKIFEQVDIVIKAEPK